MPTCGRHFDGALGVQLPLHVAEVHGILAQRLEHFRKVYARGLEYARLVHEIQNFRQRLEPVNLHLLDHGRLRGVFHRHHELLDALLPRHARNRKRALDGPEAAVERELAQKGVAL